MALIIQTATDAELVEEFARNGSQAAFEQLVDRHAAWVFAAAYRQLRDRHLAEDATQAVFLILAKKAHRMGQDQKISGWLFNTLQYVVRGMRRSERRRQQRELRLAKPQAVEAQAGDLSEYLDSAVAKLSAKDRTIVLLRFYQGLDFAQIAESMNLTESAARRRLSRAVAKLRPNVSIEAIMAATALGREWMPPNLPQQLAHNAATHAAPAGASAVAKAAAHLMRITRAKIAAAVGAAAVVAGASTYAVIAKVSTRPSIATYQPPTTPLEQFRKAYAINENHVLIRISPPFPAARNEIYFAQAHPSYSRANPPQSMIVHWNKQGEPEIWTSWSQPQQLGGLLEGVVNVFPQEIEGNTDLLQTPLPGDFVVGTDTMAPSPFLQNAVCRDIEGMLFQELTMPVTLKFQTVPRKVIVLSGHWKYTPVTGAAAQSQQVVFYSTRFDPRRSMSSGDGPIYWWAKQLGKYINEQVVLEADQLPGSAGWIASNSPVDKKLVLQHMQEQTGLKWSEEMRNVRRLFIDAQQ